MATYTYTSKLNKGHLRFDDQKIIGALGQGSDEAGNDTIELVPDIDLYASDRYLIIDPTGPDHIHIRAGGPQDDSDATLILGSELSSVIIDDQADGHVSILSRTEDDSTSHVWKFNNDGTTTFPSLSVDLHTGGSTSVETLKFSNNGLKSVITGPTPAASTAVKPLIIQGQSQTAAAGGDVYLWGGDSTTAGGNIEILAGDNDSSSGTAGVVTIKGGDGATGFGGGNVAITGGTGSAGGLHGEVTIASNSNTWTFKNNGNVTVPTSKDIVEVFNSKDCSLSSGGNRVKSVNSASGATVSYDTENIILIATDTAGAQPTTVFLPEIKDIPVGYTLTVMDSDGGAGGKNITVKPKAADEIISIGPAAAGGIIIDTSYGLVTLKNVIAGWAILYGR